MHVTAVQTREPALKFVTESDLVKRAMTCCRLPVANARCRAGSRHSI